jgi:ABC-type cobalamin/Fe3+-siderophores transport systems, ATPase components
MLLKIDNVYGGYGGNDIVKGVSCCVDSGEVLCLVGPNGCGKTTLFRLILGFIAVTKGEIQIDGMLMKEVTALKLSKLVAYIPQQHTPIFAYTVLEVVIMGRASHFSAFSIPGEIDREKAYESLEQLNILHLANEKYTTLSGGQRQMVLIARAICQAAKIFIMDEPAANLDYANQQLLMGVISNLAKKGFCVIMSTHSPEHPASVGDKVLLMKNGSVDAFGKATDVITSEKLQSVYDIEMEVVKVKDRYNNNRIICIPVKQFDK